MKKKFCKDLDLVSFGTALKWIKNQKPIEANPVYIQKYGGQSKLPFRVWAFADVVLVMSNEKAKTQSQYILSKDKWNAFCKYVKDNPTMERGELARNYKQFECTNKTFWPTVISISKAYYSQIN